MVPFATIVLASKNLQGSFADFDLWALTNPPFASQFQLAGAGKSFKKLDPHDVFLQGRVGCAICATFENIRDRIWRDSTCPSLVFATKGQSEFPDNSKSLFNSSPISAMLICLLSLKFGQFKRNELGISFSDKAGGTCKMSLTHQMWIHSGPHTTTPGFTLWAVLNLPRHLCDGSWISEQKETYASLLYFGDPVVQSVGGGAIHLANETSVVAKLLQ